jgi:Chaperone for wingless signalling and trafficking of LDL receptor
VSTGLSGGSGGKMAFVDLKETNAKGEKMTKRDVDELASLWSSLIKSGSLQANVFNIGDSKILLSVDKGWMLGDVIKFVMSRPETVKVTLDSKDYYPKDFNKSDDDDDL